MDSNDIKSEGHRALDVRDSETGDRTRAFYEVGADKRADDGGSATIRRDKRLVAGF